MPPDRVSEATYYTWKKKFGDLGVTELKRLKMLEDENARLKRIVPHSLTPVCRGASLRKGGVFREGISKVRS